MYEKQAKENLKTSTGGSNPQPLPNLVNPEDKIDTTKKLADVAGVSKETYRMGAKILSSDNEEVKEEIEFIIDNNSTREKTAEQKSREAKVLKEIESILAVKRKISTLKQNQTNGITEVAEPPHREDDIDQGKARDIVAKKVGLKSGREVERAIKTVNIIDDLAEKGRTEEAELIRGVLNNVKF